MLRLLLDQLDSNWIITNTISLDTFWEIVSFLSVQESSNCVDEVYHLLDRNHRGYIEFNDFERVLNSPIRFANVFIAHIFYLP
jgi:Ca2+-binding EF-hand superfamily protein